MNNTDIAVEKFINGYNCAQSVMFALKEYTGLSEDDSLRMATGFGAGMGRTQHVCGAVSGGILALSHLYGRGADEGREKQDELYNTVKQFIEKFEADYKTIECKDLLDGCNLLSEAGQQRFQSENMAELCQNYIRSVMNIIEDMIKVSK